MIEIKEFKAGDLNILWNINRNAFRRSLIKETYEDFKNIAENSVGKVIFLEKEIIGAIFLKEQDNCGTFKVKKLFICPKYQNRGLGYFILTHLSEEDNSIKKIELDIDESSLKAKTFCEKMKKEI
ncbi:GNAT family N-acetyltransferase [Cetobacterium somerae]|uniref:GNAT family N-acetyltransferase n=1 Tax=Cetobacterium sp. NK01 TaxID=2993530 RepID=UPI0021166190|nr:GNAT family N-acetyltransferase [Cetobacterium sp. NK01]MCQ8211215.1 GNAT family N-acetyltransferase [Cetobacterium sp. NK01]